ncbi:MAG TPA: SDR family oxidoreductase [Acidobacteriota bacterium]
METALITGASSGIGLDLAGLFAKDHSNLVLISRNESALGRLADSLTKSYGITAKVLPKDLASPSAPEEIFTELQKESIGIDVLVNNAGFGTHGFFAQTDLAKELEEMQVNMVALTHLTKLFVREMLKKGTGKIMNVASTAGFQPGPLMAVYYATKAYVISFSEALANELSGTGVTVTCLCPGPTRTDFQKRAYMQQSRIGTQRLMDSETVARIGYVAMREGKTLVIPGWDNKLLAQSARFGPRKWVTGIVRKLNSNK